MGRQAATLPFECLNFVFYALRSAGQFRLLRSQRLGAGKTRRPGPLEVVAAQPARRVEHPANEIQARLANSLATSFLEVAYSIGSNDLSYFTRAFKRQLGVCLSDYPATAR